MGGGAEADGVRGGGWLLWVVRMGMLVVRGGRGGGRVGSEEVRRVRRMSRVRVEAECCSSDGSDVGGRVLPSSWWLRRRRGRRGRSASRSRGGGGRRVGCVEESGSAEEVQGALHSLSSPEAVSCRGSEGRESEY